MLQSQDTMRVVRPKGESGGQVFLTFDDGPDPIWTPKVLEALHQSGAKATFFVIAPLASRIPYLIHRMIRAGHSVEFHCSKHLRHTELTRAEIEVDAREGLRTLRELGVSPSLWRTPWGPSRHVLRPWRRTSDSSSSPGPLIPTIGVGTTFRRC